MWQFLAAIGLGASPEQQQRLVMAVKYVLRPSSLSLPSSLPQSLRCRQQIRVPLTGFQGSRHGNSLGEQGSSTRDVESTPWQRQSVHESHRSRRRAARLKILIGLSSCCVVHPKYQVFKNSLCWLRARGVFNPDSLYAASKPCMPPLSSCAPLEQPKEPVRPRSLLLLFYLSVAVCSESIDIQLHYVRGTFVCSHATSDILVPNICSARRIVEQGTGGALQTKPHLLLGC